MFDGIPVIQIEIRHMVIFYAVATFVVGLINGAFFLLGWLVWPLALVLTLAVTCVVLSHIWHEWRPVRRASIEFLLFLLGVLGAPGAWAGMMLAWW